MNTIKFVAWGNNAPQRRHSLRAHNRSMSVGTRSIAKTATRYNDAFKVFELSDHGTIDRMFSAAKERRA